MPRPPSRPVQLLLVVLAALVVGGAVGWPTVAEERRRTRPTAEYIARFDAAEYERRGMDFVNERYRPERIGKPLDEIDRVLDYDFARLRETMKRLEDVDRLPALRAIFAQVTAGATTDTDRHLAVLRFLQRASVHNMIQPMHEDGTIVGDPLVLLELGEMRCGHVARVAVDLFEAVGFDARLVQLGGHVIAEVFYEGGWHYVDADLFGGGQIVIEGDGRIPSVTELSRRPLDVDRLPSNQELSVQGGLPGSSPYVSYFYFSRKAYGSYPPMFYVKTADDGGSAKGRHYGWNRYRKITDEDRRLTDLDVRYAPGAVRFESVRLEGDRAVITWRPAADRDGDLLGYRVFVSTSPRGWNYETYKAPPSVLTYWRGGWKPEMYDALFRLPPSDAGFLEVTETSATIDVPPDEARYVTVMPFDEHGERVGRELYFTSPELVFDRRRSSAP